MLFVVYLTNLTKITATNFERIPFVDRNPPVGNHWFDKLWRITDKWENMEGFRVP